MESMGADAAAGLPEPLDGGRDFGGHTAAAAPLATAPSRSAGASSQADDRLAVHVGDRDDLIQECLLLRSVGLPVSGPLSRRVFPQARSCHDALLR